MTASSSKFSQKFSVFRWTENGSAKIPFRNLSLSVSREEKIKITEEGKGYRINNEYETETETETEQRHGKVPADLRKVFGHLGLLDFQDKVSSVRVRQHANPLSSSSMPPVEIPNWEEIFEDPNRPLFVDIGCGSGRFLLALAKRDLGNRNFLGLEIRQKLVGRSVAWVQELGFTNIHFLFANANVSLAEILKSYPGPLHYVTILCPDPHFKVRHRKRRVVQPSLVETIAKNLVTKGQLYVASDVEEVAKYMRNQIESFENGQFFELKTENGNIETDANGWLQENPLEVPTERELAVFTNGGCMYRALYTKI